LLTNPEWVMVGIVALGTVAQLWVAAKRQGADDRTLLTHGDDIIQLKLSKDDHETRISRVEGRLQMPSGVNR
jgi:hypothetical protein